MSDRIIAKVSNLQKELDIKDKRISLLTETLASRDKDIETLKAEIMRQNNIIVQSPEWLMKALDIKEQLNDELRKTVKELRETLAFKDNVIDKQDECLVRCGKELMQAEGKRADMQFEIEQQQKVIKTMATCIKNNTTLETLVKNICKNTKVCVSQNQSGTCEECIMKNITGI